MIIKSLEIQNYRKMDGSKFDFNKKRNYIVGKNNIGKTSTLNLLETLLTCKNFQPDDFDKANKPITINLKVDLAEEEIGVFDDNFSPENSNEIIIKFEQESIDDPLKFYHFDTKSDIRASQLKKSNLISYSSNIKPIKTRDLLTEYGDYKFIPNMVKHYIEKNRPPKITKTDYDKELLSYLNSNLKKIRPFEEGNVIIDFAKDYTEIINGSLKLENTDNIDFSKLGFGLQFSTLIPLKIIDQIIKWKKYNRLDDHLIKNNKNKKVLNIILTVDEPEVHLYPNLQLKLMKYINNILAGKNKDFNNLLNNLFDIDEIQGQLFVVTHSPYILSNCNYKEVIRLTEVKKKLFVVSGVNIKFSSSEQKQLKRKLTDINSSLFADSVIIVEGDTEQIAFKIFAQTLGIDLIEYNTNIMKADGIKNVFILSKLFDEFKIKNSLVIDSDGKDILEIKKNYLKGRKKPDNLFITCEKDFEHECFENMSLSSINHYLSDFEKSINKKNYNGSFWFKVFSKTDKNKIKNSKDIVTTIDQILDSFTKDKDKEKETKNCIKTDFMKNFLKKKSILNGELIARYTNPVPRAYKDAIEYVTEYQTKEGK